MALDTVVVTGAAGLVGTAIRGALREAATRLVLVDRRPLTPEAPGEEVRQAVLDSPETVAGIVAGADAIVHLAGVPDEAPLPDLLEGNVLGTHHVLEAARRAGVPRVVLASSNRLTGCYPSAVTVSPDMPPRPDGLYGVSKVAVEALGRLYADKFGLEVVCLRIGSLEPEPADARQLSTWLSPGDCAGFFVDALTRKDAGFRTLYAVSANTRRFWELSEGYQPQDDAEAYAGTLGDTEGPALQGGAYADPAYTLRHLT
ncbi:NAD-dependent epimerase/dehydratase family protein [Nonomuraea sp. NPDC003754]